MTGIAQRFAALPLEKQAALLQHLRQKAVPVVAASSSSGWIVRYQPNEQAPMRLFCFSYAGGGASVFRPWVEALAPEIEVCCIQLPGHEYRLAEPACTRLADLIEPLAQALLPYLDRPFAFYGHSMGALISFELARYVRRVYNRLPARLCLGAYRAPQLPNPNIKIYHLPAEVFKVVLRADGIPEKILQNEELMQAMLPTLRADFELCDTHVYRAEEPLDCPFSIFGGLEDVRISRADLEQWHVHCAQQADLVMLPGAHFFLHSSQDLLLGELSQVLAIQKSFS